MTLATSAYRPDIEARELRERFDLACVRGDEHEIVEAAKALVRFRAEHPEYELLKLVPCELGKPEPVRQIESQYDGRCKACGSRYSRGDLIYWSSESGARCGGCK